MAAPRSTAPGTTVPTLVAPDGPWTELHLPDPSPDGHHYEIVDGCLHASPPPPAGHQEIVDKVVATLRGTAPPNWQSIGRVGVRLGGSRLIPDVTVLRPGSPDDPARVAAADVALVVEVESPHSRRFDRCLKPALYAEAGIESYWRIECPTSGPVAHLYTRPGRGRYQLHRAVHAGQCVTAELPYAVQVAPATWPAAS